MESNPLSQFIVNVIEFVTYYLVPLVFALAFLLFLFGVFKYFFQGQNEESRKEGRTFIMWGIIALAIMFAVWGLVNVLLNTFGLKGEARPCLPTFSGPCNAGEPVRSTNTGPSNTPGN